MQLARLCALPAAMAIFACMLKDPGPGGAVPAGAVSGFLVDAREKAVAGATLRNRSGGVAVSGEDGWFRLPIVPGRDTVWSVYHPDFLDTVFTEAHPKSGVELSKGKLRLRSRFAILRGTVQDPEGNRLRGAGVAIEHQDAYALSGGNAEFTLGKVLPGDLTLYFSHGGTGWGDTNLRVVADSVYMGIVLRKHGEGGAVSGIVTDSGGRPAAGAVVKAQGVLEKRTDSSGYFAYTNLPPGYALRLSVRWRDRALDWRGIRAREGELLSLGKVRLADAAPLVPGKLIPSDFLAGPDSLLTLSVADSAGPGRGLLRFFWDWDADDDFDTVTAVGFLRVPVGACDTVVRVFGQLTDSTGTDTATFRILKARPRPPIFKGPIALLAVPDYRVNLGDTLRVSLDAEDPDGGRIGFSLSSGDSALFLEGDMLVFIPAMAAAKTVTGSVSAVDPDRDTAWLGLSLRVNYPPRLVTQAPVFRVGKESRVPIALADPDTDQVHVRLEAGYPGKMEGDTVFTWTPVPADTSRREIRFRLEDAYGASQTGILPIDVRPE